MYRRRGLEASAQCCYKRRVSNKRRSLIDAGSSEARVLINAGGVYLRWPVTVIPQIYFSLHVRTSTVSTFARRTPRAHVELDVRT